VGHPSEVDEIFDDISYNKGASVIRMLHSYIGDEAFKKGMHHYLTKHQYKNTFTEDLWASLEDASQKPIGTMMSTWTKQTGFPVIKVTARQDGNNRILQLSQERFIADGSVDSENSQWIVPISISTAQNPQKIATQVTMKNRSMEVVIEGVKESDWVKVNPGTVGFYRVQYSPEMLGLFRDAIRNKTLPPLDRLGLLDDAFAMVQAGQTTTMAVLDLMLNYANEDNYTVWSALCTCLGRLSTLLSHTPSHAAFKKWGCTLMSEVTKRIGWDPAVDENHLNTLLRSLVLDRMGIYGDAGVISEATHRFLSHASGTTNISADLRGAVYRTVLSVGDEKTYDTMLRLYREADLHEEKDRISRALGSLRDPALLRRVLDFSMSEEVRSQDTVFVIISVAMNPSGREIAWQFFREKYQELITRYNGGFLISRLVKYVTENYASEEKALEVQDFFAEHAVPGAERTIQQSIENIRLNANWLARDGSAIMKWISDHE
jgi:puromycin-sensitive aminopeptidase